MSAADVQAIRDDLGRLAQVLMAGITNSVFNAQTHPWLADPKTFSTAKIDAESRLRDEAILAAVQGLDTDAVLTRIDVRAAELREQVERVDEDVVAALPGRTDEDLVAVLRELLGAERLAHLARLILGEQPA